MPRDLEVSNENRATFQDGVSQGEITLIYRTPTNAERVKFDSACYSGKGKKVKISIAEAQLKYGAKILTGIPDGEFTHAGKPISSDPSSEHYREDWKRLVLIAAGDLVQALAQLVFGAVLINMKAEEPEVETEEEEDVDSEVPGLDDSSGEEGASDVPLI